MAKHFIAVLGTSLYEPVIYEDNLYQSPQEFEFVQMALIDKYKDELAEEDARITIFVTDFSKKQNYLNRTYTKKEQEIAGYWKSTKASNVIEGNVKKGFEEQFQEYFPQLSSKLDPIPIADMKTEEELGSGFQAMYSCIREGDEIIFDLTHGFRSIPMLAITIVEYAKILKNCRLLDITYGAFEAANREEAPKHVPLINLNVYDEIIAWSQAANIFMRYGQADMMKNLYKEKMKRIPNEEKREWKPVENMLDAAETLSNAILTSRGVDAEYVNKKGKPKYSVKSAYQMFKARSDETIEEKARQVQPLYPLFEKAKERFEIFDKEKNYQVGFAVTKWCIENNMIQQGYTSLEETIKTFLCNYYGLDEISEKTRDKMVGNFALEIVIAEKVKNIEFQDNEAKESYCRKILEEKKYKEWSEEEKQQAVQIFITVPDKMSEIMNTIKDFRNDINHFGMRSEPKSADTLKDKLIDCYEKTMKCVEEMEQTKK